MRKTRILAALAATLLLGTSAHAVTLSIVPALASVTSGSSISLDIVISDINNLSTPSLGAFDFDIAFDSSVLTLSNYSLGTFLGDPDAFEALDLSVGTIAADLTNVAQVSLLADTTLDALQPNSFVLATLDFIATSSVTTTTMVVFASVLASDSMGNLLPIANQDGAEISVRPVPLPASVWLLACALGALGSVRRRRLS